MYFIYWGLVLSFTESIAPWSALLFIVMCIISIKESKGFIYIQNKAIKRLEVLVWSRIYNTWLQFFKQTRNKIYFLIKKVRLDGFSIPLSTSSLKKKITSPLLTKFFISNLEWNAHYSMYLRKNKSYSKAKYSRTRIFCRSIVYIGLLINIFFVLELNSLYYAISINYGYFVWPSYIIVWFIVCRFVLKYKLFYKETCFQEIKKLITVLKS